MSEEKPDQENSDVSSVEKVEAGGEDGSVSSGESSTMVTSEVVDRNDKKALKEAKKAAKAAKIPKMAKAPKMPEDDLASGLKTGRLAAAKKKKMKNAAIVAGFFLFIFLGNKTYHFLFDPKQAPATYGICRVYMELQVKFPTHLKFVGLENFGSNVRIWYTRVDPFGATRMESIRCYFANSKERGTYIERILIERREEPSDKVARFNQTIPIIRKNMPNLDWPRSDTGKSMKGIYVDSATVRQRVM